MSAIHEKKEVSKVEMVVTGYTCDVCGQKVDSTFLPPSWHSFSHSHGGWGNDSFESTESFDVCSPKCFIERIRMSVKELSVYERDGAEVADMQLPFARGLANAFTERAFS